MHHGMMWRDTLLIWIQLLGGLSSAQKHDHDDDDDDDDGDGDGDGDGDDGGGGDDNDDDISRNVAILSLWPASN